MLDLKDTGLVAYFRARDGEFGSLWVRPRPTGLPPTYSPSYRVDPGQPVALGTGEIAPAIFGK